MVNRDNSISTERGEELVQELADKHGVSMTALLGPSRARFLVKVRQEVYYLLLQAGLDSMQIADIMHRDRTTVMHGVKRHRADLEREREKNTKDRQARERARENGIKLV